MPIFTIIMLLLAASQVYWLWRGHRLARRLVRARSARIAVELAVFAFYLAALAYSFGWIGRRATSTRLTPADALLEAPFLWWAASSLFGFVIAMLFQFPLALRRLLAPPVSPSRRRFFERSAAFASAAPFVAGAYGLFYGRLNLETTAPRIRLPRLPAAFHGFRIAQLSDIHIGPFMTQDQIRRFVAITNQLKPDLIVLTGDFVTWDKNTQQAVVEALSGLRAPFGVFGCLGNHERWSRTEDSITELFRHAGVRILRRQRALFSSGGERLNLMGIDFPLAGFAAPVVPPVADLIEPGAVNILLSHSPGTFDGAADLGVDLSLSGHTHGGQLALEFISPEIAPSRLVTPYVSGWFQRPGGQLYVNRGIGTIGVPIRLGAPPEISVFELQRGA